MYVTSSGATEIDIILDNPNYLSPYFTCRLGGTIEIDWGDNSSKDTITQSPTDTIYQNHTYNTIGNYTIKITVINGTLNLYSNSNSYVGILRVNNLTKHENRIYCNTI